MKLTVGEIYRTPFEPSGLVKVLCLEPAIGWQRETAFIEHIGDHPHGYKNGTHGRYFADELRPVDDVKDSK